MPTVAFATDQERIHLTGDDLLTIEPLNARGVHVVPAVWTDPQVRWQDFDLVVIRSVWDYHQHVDAFRSWLVSLEQCRARVCNPVATLRSNIDKSYLQDLQRAGFAVIPTEYALGSERRELSQIMRDRGWPLAVVKPTISSSAHGTFRTSLETASSDQPAFERLLNGGAAMIQPFVPQIVELGEWSLIFFNGEFSHAVLKRPAQGDYRVQAEHGGSSLLSVPPATFIERARAVIHREGEPLLYARVDGVAIDGEFTLIEVELNEPLLFLASDSAAPARFAAAIARRIAKDR